jgi:hypothetical protein
VKGGSGNGNKERERGDCDMQIEPISNTNSTVMAGTMVVIVY